MTEAFNCMALPQMGYANGYPQLPPPNPSSDTDGVGLLKIGSGLGIAVQALFWTGFIIFYLIFMALESTVSSFGARGAVSIPTWITVNTFYFAVAAIAGGLMLGVVSYVFYFLGFRAIRKGDPTFGAPTSLMIVGLIGYLMAAGGVVLVLGTVVSGINSVATGTVTAGSAVLDLNVVFGGLALIGLGAILGLIGVIGLVLGNWRAGTRYRESSAKVGAILSIIPIVSIVGYVLLLIGYIRAGSKLKNGWAVPRALAYYPAPVAPPPGYYGAPAPPMGYPVAPPPPPGYQAAPTTPTYYAQGNGSNPPPQFRQ
jgi:hypothetical protein